MVQLLLETAKHTLQLVELMQSGGSGGQSGNAGVVGDEGGQKGALEVSGTSADNFAAAAERRLPFQEQQQQGAVDTGRDEWHRAILWGACHLVESAKTVGKNMGLEGCCQQEAKETEQLL